LTECLYYSLKLSFYVHTKCCSFRDKWNGTNTSHSLKYSYISRHVDNQTTVWKIVTPRLWQYFFSCNKTLLSSKILVITSHFVPHSIRVICLSYKHTSLCRNIAWEFSLLGDNKPNKWTKGWDKICMKQRRESRRTKKVWWKSDKIKEPWITVARRSVFPIRNGYKKNLGQGRGNFVCMVIWIEYVQASTRWFKYDRGKLWLVYTQIVPVIFEPPCTYVICENIRLFNTR
jgi:hypothetical protein